MNYDGWVVISTKLDSKQLEKDLKNAERRLKQYEKEAQKLTEQKAKIQIEVDTYELEKADIKKATNETLMLAQTEEQVAYELDMEKMQLLFLQAARARALARAE